jgi:3-oxoacyl-[acyl-carrier protein] reductase
MDFGIEDKSALLMASTRGLGLGCAAALVSEGVSVVINGRNEQQGKEAVSQLGEKARFIRADISERSERERLFNEAQAILGTISILVTNADGSPSGSFMSKTSDDWQAAFDLTMLSALDMARRCIPGMIEQGYGRIVSINSVSAKETTPGPVLANGIKPGLLGALGTLAREVAASGVTVNSILPGPFDTDLLRRYAQKAIGDGKLSPEEAVQHFAEKSPMKRLGRVEEFGALCAFLCSPHAGYITGQSIVIDGGKTPTLL